MKCMGPMIPWRDDTFVLLPKKGHACKTSEGRTGYGFEPCFAIAIWDPVAETFLSKNREIWLSEFN